MKLRFWFLALVLALVYAVLFFHLYKVQLSEGNYYFAKAESQFSASSLLLVKRGAIYFTDKNGNHFVVAVDKNFPLIYAVPKDMTDRSEELNQLALLIGTDVSVLEKMVPVASSDYALIAKKVDAYTAGKVENAKLKGIYVDYVPERYYPANNTAAQVLGFVGPNNQNNGESGRYGLEKYYDDVLSGAAGFQQNGKIVSPQDGKDIFLTIDPNIQNESEQILKDLIKNFGASGGSVIVEDPTTGKILAMTGSPNFDPNNYNQSPLSNFLNYSVQQVYEPGSIMKVLTMAAGIDSGKITPDMTYNDMGYVNVNGAHITNYNFTTHGAYGPGTTMTEIIEHSINTGAIFVENKTGNVVFADYIKKFGLGDKTGIDLPGEVSGNLNQLNLKSPQIDFDTVAYGQGIAVTPLELLTAVSAIANGGVMMRPYINEDLGPRTIGRVIDSNTAVEVVKMMVDAVDLAGVANIKGYLLAGKTGSAYIPDLQQGGYQNKLIDSYIGFGPTSNPRFIALIKLNGLSADSLAAESVVPAFKELSQYIINYYNIPPDRL